MIGLITLILQIVWFFIQRGISDPAEREAAMKKATDLGDEAARTGDVGPLRAYLKELRERRKAA